MSQICIVLGSRSDLEVLAASKMTDVIEAIAAELLSGEGDLTYSVSICSAHRNAVELEEYVREALESGAKVFIGVAGMAAALPGALAGLSLLYGSPVIGVPLDEHGIDSCLYMPPGVPVLLAGVGKVGLKNAALAACQIVAVNDEQLQGALRIYLSKNTKQAEFNITIEEN